MHRLTKVLTVLWILAMSLPPAGLALPAQGETEAGSAWTPLRVQSQLASGQKAARCVR